jgi:TonB family protein
MFAPIVLAILVAHAPLTAHASATQQPPAPADQITPETPWPPAGVFRYYDERITRPRLINGPKPHYRASAMRAKVQGSVKMEAVVETDGKIGEVRVVRSMDKEFGMDDEAVETLKQWLFVPGTKDGAAVPVLIEVEMTFTMGKKK